MKWSKRGDQSIQAGEYIISRALVQGREIHALWRGTAAVSRHDDAASAKAAAKEKA